MFCFVVNLTIYKFLLYFIKKKINKNLYIVKFIKYYNKIF